MGDIQASGGYSQGFTRATDTVVMIGTEQGGCHTLSAGAFVVCCASHAATPARFHNLSVPAAFGRVEFGPASQGQHTVQRLDGLCLLTFPADVRLMLVTVLCLYTSVTARRKSKRSTAHSVMLPHTPGSSLAKSMSVRTGLHTTLCHAQLHAGHCGPPAFAVDCCA